MIQCFHPSRSIIGKSLRRSRASICSQNLTYNYNYVNSIGKNKGKGITNRFIGGKDFSSINVIHHDWMTSTNIRMTMRHFSSSPPPAAAYEGPFASLAKRLKRISITSAVVSLVGVPLLIAYQQKDPGALSGLISDLMGELSDASDTAATTTTTGGTGGNSKNIPLSGQIAVGGTAMLAATGSTAALSFCFSPYVHSLEWITIRKKECCSPPPPQEQQDSNQTEKEGSAIASSSSKEHMLLKATTTNLFSIPVETIFDPTNPDVITNDPKVVQAATYRPFCNFLVTKDDGTVIPLYVHPELVHDYKLRDMLLGSHGDDDDDDDGNDGENISGERKEGLANDATISKKKKQKKDDDDDLF